MKTKQLTFLLALSFLFLFSGSVYGNDLDDGRRKNCTMMPQSWDAYKRKDYKKAFRLLLPLAEKGFHHAQYCLGLMYENGQGVPQDKKEAVNWLLKSAEQKNLLAQSLIRGGYQKLHKQAAEQGDSYAQRFLGASFYLGLGVTQDYAEAAKWYKKAAEQGDSSAQNILGAMYEMGKGIPKDYVEAYKWFSISGESGNGYGQLYRKKIEKRKMTPDQIAEAQRLAKESVEKNK
jgi:TPR repeat protein